MTTPACDLSVVIPIFNEELHLAELRQRLLSVLESTGLSWEVVFVDDGSADASLHTLRRFAAEDPRLKVSVLSRNFGNQPAMTAGLRRARGRVVVMMDGDLQDPPEVLPELLRAWRAGGQVVRAVRRSRGESLLRRSFTAVFYRLMGALGGVRLGADNGNFSLLDRKALNALLSLEERNRYLAGLRAWTGFRQTEIFYDRPARTGDGSKQSFLGLLQYAFDALFSFSHVPLRLASLAGALVCVLVTAYSVFLVIARLLDFHVVPGFTTTAVAVMTLGGFTLLCLGIIGEYLARIYDEVKRRPLFIESEFLNGGE